MHIPLVYKHPFYKYFVPLSVGQATKGKRALLLMDVVILVFFVNAAIAVLFVLNGGYRISPFPAPVRGFNPTGALLIWMYL